MRNKALLTIFILLLSVVLQAQTYTVYSVIGTSCIVEGKKQMPLQPRKLVNNETRLMVGHESAVTLLDEKGNRMFSFSKEGTYSVAEVVKNKSKAKSITKQYMSYLLKQLFADGSQKMAHPDMYMQVTAASYRAATIDSLLLCRVAQGLPSDMNVSFDLMDCDSDALLNGKVKAGTSCYVRVHNHTDEPLYVNVLNTDANGQKYLVLPVDEVAACAHLLVPSMSTVAFREDPFVFTDEGASETFLLVATREPVDFSILLGAAAVVEKAGRKGMKVGLSINNYQVCP